MYDELLLNFLGCLWRTLFSLKMLMFKVVLGMEENLSSNFTMFGWPKVLVNIFSRKTSFLIFNATP